MSDWFDSLMGPVTPACFVWGIIGASVGCAWGWFWTITISEQRISDPLIDVSVKAIGYAAQLGKLEVENQRLRDIIEGKGEGGLK